MKITAKGMFKKLGYTKRVLDDRIFYGNGNYIMRHIIEFNLKDKIVYSCTEYETGNAIKSLTVNELKAIQKQMEELGWI